MLYGRFSSIGLKILYGLGLLMVCDEMKLGYKHFLFCLQGWLHDFTHDFIFCGWSAGWLGGFHIQGGF